MHTPDEVLAVLRSDPRFQPYPVRAQGPGFVEIGLAAGSLVLAWPEAWRDTAGFTPHLRRARSGYTPLVLCGSDADFAELSVARLRDEADIAVAPIPVGEDRLSLLLRNFDALCRLRRQAAEEQLAIGRYQIEIDELNAIGRALSSERNIDKLLDLILEKTRHVTGADAGSVYTVEGEDNDPHRMLRFKISQNDSAKRSFTGRELPVNPESIVGRCVLTHAVINVPDLYRLDEPGTGNNPWGLRHNRAFDEKYGYETHSMLAVPMINAEDRVIGVIQLINCKPRRDLVLVAPADFARVMPFDERAENLAKTLASQAGISLENALLYGEIHSIFEGFVHASVTAIEARDPTTSGHSQRVAETTVRLAMATDRVVNGPYAGYRASWDEIKQIEYAALLHDFGKVGVREPVLVKPRKLYDHERDLVVARFDYIKKSLEAEAHKRKVHALMSMPREQALASLDLVDDEFAARVRELDDSLTFIMGANEPTVLVRGGLDIGGRLADIAQRTYRDPRGVERPYLREEEIEALSILRGSLTVVERIEIESHVSHTYNYLRRIPWGRTLRRIPEYAGSHHEKLDGTGYPRRLKGAEIPAPARMMTIADIFDALTASDRPYKRAVPVEHALDIIRSEVSAGKCDADLFVIFVEARCWQPRLEVG